MIIKSTDFFFSHSLIHSPTSVTMFSNWYRVNLIFNKSLWLIAEKLAFLSPFVRLFCVENNVGVMDLWAEFCVHPFDFHSDEKKKMKPVKMAFRNEFFFFFGDKINFNAYFPCAQNKCHLLWWVFHRSLFLGAGFCWHIAKITNSKARLFPLDENIWWKNEMCCRTLSEEVNISPSDFCCSKIKLCGTACFRPIQIGNDLAVHVWMQVTFRFAWFLFSARQRIGYKIPIWFHMKVEIKTH